MALVWGGGSGRPNLETRIRIVIKTKSWDYLEESLKNVR